MTGAKVPGVGDLQRSRQTWYRWKNWLERFARNQRDERDWINFAEIDEWYRDLAGPHGSREIAHSDVYRMLQQDMLDGDFEQNGRSAVRLLHPRMMRRMQPEYFRSILETHGKTKIQSEILPHCWFPRSSFEQWCAKHHLPRLPPRFQTKQQNAPPSEVYKTGSPGRPSSMDLIKAELHARAGRKETMGSLTEEVDVLLARLKKAYPNAPQPKPKSVKNALRYDYRKLKPKKAQK